MEVRGECRHHSAGVQTSSRQNISCEARRMQNADRRPCLGWQWESRERGKRQRSRCKAGLAEFSEPRRVICICFSPSSSRFGLEKVVWRVLGLKSCSQKADDYLKNSVCLTLATSVPLFHLLFFKSIPFT